MDLRVQRGLPFREAEGRDAAFMRVPNLTHCFHFSTGESRGAELRLRLEARDDWIGIPVEQHAAEIENGVPNCRRSLWELT